MRGILLWMLKQIARFRFQLLGTREFQSVFKGIKESWIFTSEVSFDNARIVIRLLQPLKGLVSQQKVRCTLLLLFDLWYHLRLILSYLHVLPIKVLHHLEIFTDLKHCNIPWYFILNHLALLHHFLAEWALQRLIHQLLGESRHLFLILKFKEFKLFTREDLGAKEE